MMKYKRLGKTNLRVSVIGLGTWQLGDEWCKRFDQPEVDVIVGRAGELGINLTDTNGFCFVRGELRRVIGAA